MVICFALSLLLTGGSKWWTRIPSCLGCWRSPPCPSSSARSSHCFAPLGGDVDRSDTAAAVDAHRLPVGQEHEQRPVGEPEHDHALRMRDWRAGVDRPEGLGVKRQEVVS